MSFPLGADVLVPARVIALYGQGRAPEYQQVSLQLGDGQHLITHPLNCRPMPAPPVTEIKAQEPVEDKAVHPAQNKALRPRHKKAAEVTGGG